MELKNLLTPWNWFKKEEEQSQTVRSQNVSRPTEHPLARFHRDLDQLFDNVFQGFPLSPGGRENISRWAGFILPHVDIGEDKEQYTITVEVPGVAEKDIQLTLADGTLMIQGEKRSEQEDKNKHYHRIERSYGSFQRLLSLPTDADENTVEAKFRDGVLTITIAKDPQAKSPVRHIAIT
ncbi:MAG: Hsp20/alpha crystallin family protein [Nitrospirales bacterium]|nr:Hsp20/alpha crystallin family protein [Nitrospirales bacterium]